MAPPIFVARMFAPSSFVIVRRRSLVVIVLCRVSALLPVASVGRWQRTRSAVQATPALQCSQPLVAMCVTKFMCAPQPQTAIVSLHRVSLSGWQGPP